MSVKLDQINVTYIRREDRLLVKICNTDGEEYRVWYTRRFTRLLMSVFDENLLAESRSQGAVDREAQSAFAEYQHLQNVREESFAREYRDNSTTSEASGVAQQQLRQQGDMLAHTIKYKARDNGGLKLSVVAENEVNLTLNMDKTMKHQFYELVRRSVSMADWGLELAAESMASGAKH